jgi:hypothetical protein
VPDAKVAGCGRRIAEEKNFAVLQFPARRRGSDRGEEIEALRDGVVVHVRRGDFAQAERDAECGRAAGVGFRAVGIAGAQRLAAAIRVRDARGGEQRAFHLHVVHVLRIRDAGARQTAPGRVGDFAHLRHRSDLLRRDVARHLDRHGEARLARLSACGGAHENRRVRRQHALGAARPDECDALAHLVGR